jgi:hypothetical protein
MADERSAIETASAAIAVVALTALAYSLGWLKEYYYFAVFGVPLASLDVPIQHYLFESWFVVQNVLFLALIWWAVLAAECGKWYRFWLIVVAVVYSLIPISSNYAYNYPSFWPAMLLATHKHGVLKFFPFIVIAMLWWRGRLDLKKPDALRWPYSKFSFAVVIVLFLALAISMAKHIGSADANRALKSPDDWFSRVVKLYTSGDSQVSELPATRSLYLLYANPTQYFVLDYSGFSFEPKKHPDVRVIVLPRDKVGIETSYKFQVQPGSLYW